MKRFILFSLLSLLFLQCIYADEIYLNTGYVYKNVKILDTAGVWVRLQSISDTTIIPAASILHIVPKAINPKEEKLIELYSQERKSAYEDSLHAQVLIREGSRKDSVTKVRTEYKREFPLYGKSYGSVGAGFPGATNMELGLTFSNLISFGMIYIPHEHWSEEPAYGLCSSVYFPGIIHNCIPFVYSSVATNFAKEISTSSNFVNISVGSIIPINSFILLRPVIGVNHSFKFTGKYTGTFKPKTICTGFLSFVFVIV